jgi:excisionase family DNA binding protein
MGSDFYSIDEAANRLGCCRKTIHNYIKKGFLSSQRNGRDTMVLKKDVEQLSIDLGTDAPALNRANWFKLYARLEKMERELFTVKHILEIRDEPLRVSPLECIQLHDLSVNFLTKSSWTLPEMELWAKYFERMDDTFLKALAEANQNQKAWQPLFKLCIFMIRQVGADLEKKPTVPLQSLLLKLDEGRKKLRGTILMWVASGQGGLPEAFLATLEDPQETVARRLGGSNGKS